MYSFGLGHKLGVDVPSEKNGKIPTPKTYNSLYGDGHWNFCTFRSVSIGQGEVDVTPLQVANEMAYLANKGWYKIPHLVDSIEHGDTYSMLTKYKEEHTAMDIPDSVFEAVHDGMQGVMETGTGAYANVPGIIVCGKTGTVENAYKGVKQKDHAFFAAFAPRDNPRIAIAVICENAGQGAWAAAPIASLLVEKYLRDSIVGDERQAMEKEFINKNLIPQRMRLKLQQLDSLKRIKEAQILLQQKLKEADDETDTEQDIVQPEIKTVPVPAKKTPLPVKKTDPAATLISDEKKNKKNNR